MDLQKIKQRSRIIKIIRAFFDKRDFLEVDTPLLVRLPGMEPNLDPFKTKLIDFDGHEYEAYLITSPEYAMKKLLVQGYGKIYQLSKVFRNKEDWTRYHNPEFTMVEWYRDSANYENIIQDVIHLCQNIAYELFAKLNFTYQGKIIDLSNPEIITVKQAFKHYASVDLDSCMEREALKLIAIKKGYSISDETWEDIFFKIFLTEIEPNLGNGKLTILKDYPASMASLSKIKKDDAAYAERFEAYIEGIELCNGFSELTDAQEQLKRLREEQALREKNGKDFYDIDMGFIHALQLGMPESGGVALGVDRLCMLFTDSQDIKDILLFSAQEMFAP